MKLPLYIALCVSLLYYSISVTDNPRLELLGEGEYAIYSRDDIHSSLVERRVASGIGYIYYTTSANAPALRTLFTNIDGESIVLPRISGRQVFKKLGYQEVSPGYGYSPRGRDYIKVDGQRVNLQVVERNNSTVVGWPVVLGTY